jgi:hypothetical protein
MTDAFIREAVRRDLNADPDSTVRVRTVVSGNRRVDVFKYRRTSGAIAWSLLELRRAENGVWLFVARGAFVPEEPSNLARPRVSFLRQSGFNGSLLGGVVVGPGADEVRGVRLGVGGNVYEDSPSQGAVAFLLPRLDEDELGATTELFGPNDTLVARYDEPLSRLVSYP